jgi:regulator of sigma E protease
MSLGVAILGLAVLILVHEAGHFVAARSVGMRPRKFYIGFPFPTALVKATRGGVEYGIGVIPLGGYVKIPGMHRPAAGDLRASLPLTRAEELISPLDALDEAIERGDDNAALARLDELEPELPGNRLLPEIRDGLAPDAYWRQPAWKRVFVIAAGPLTNIAFAVVLFALAFSAVGSIKLTRGVQSVLPGTPALAAGLHAGDRIVSVAGRPVAATGIQSAIEGTRGHPFTLVVERDSHRVTLGPLRAHRDSDGVYRIGFEIKTVDGPGDSPTKAVTSSLSAIGSITWDTAKAIGQLAHGQGTHNVSSVVGMVRDTAQAYQISIWDFVGFVGALSLVLGLANLLPLLPFDGGHIVMSVLEGIRRRAFSQLVYMRYSAVGLTIFALLLYLGLRNDTGL